MEIKRRKVSDADFLLIDAIASRFEREFPEFRETIPRHVIVVNLLDVHDRIPLDLPAMFSGRLSDFAHDIGGIVNRWDPANQEFRDCFHPRYAKD
jgi:hypothetical protein